MKRFTENLSLQLSVEQADALARLSVRTKTPQSVLVRMGIELLLKEENSRISRCREASPRAPANRIPCCPEGEK